MFKQRVYSANKRKKMSEFFNKTVNSIISLCSRTREYINNNRLPYRSAAAFFATLLLGVLVVEMMGTQKLSEKYNISSIESILLEEPVPLYASKLNFTEAGGYVYNEGYTAGVDVVGDSSAPKFSASFNIDGDNGVAVNDVVNNVEFKIIPDFKLEEPIKNENRVVQPLAGMNATKVFTLKGSAIKEDLVLFEYQRDELEFDYRLELPEYTETRMESDGSIGVYGISQELLGNVSVGSDEDQVLLDKLRNTSEKSTILFKIPAPFIVEANKKVSKNARAWFSMPDKNTLRVHASGLGQARYPLSIDPSVYIETARKLMRGNNESNIDFNVTNELIQKGSTTGARFDDWNVTTQLNDPRWNGGADVTGGFIYYVGGATEGGLVETPYTTAGSSTFTVPAGITSVTVKAWGAGGGGGGGAPDRPGGAGGGGGYASTTLTGLTPGSTLYVRVGGGGGGGTGFSTGTNSGNGGGGGGYSGVFSGITPSTANALIVAAGGGGGGGGNADTGSTARQPGDDAGAGGGTTGITGDGNDTTTGGSGGTQSAGGSGGTVGGTAGAALTGGVGGTTGAAQTNGGTNGGGNGGTQQNAGGPNKKPGGGGGGAGYYGGGGGGQANSQFNGGAGGGGGSSYTSGSPSTNAAGNGQDPGNKNDADRGGVADGGAGGASGSNGTSGDNGKVIISYSTGGSGAVQNEVFWAQLNESNGAIETPNPGDGSCVNWCTLSAYNLPAERQAHSLVAYNGFLYVFGGQNDSGTRQSTVYIAKLGANGEPQLWHPTDNNQNNWVYWYADTSLPSERTYHSAVAYNNRMYLLGGQTNASTGGVTTVHTAEISPTGILGTWTTTGTTALPSARWGHTVHIYNDYMYLIGGNSSGTLQNTIYYNKLNSDGTMNAWRQTESFSGARMSWGGKNTTVWGGYLYLHSGCTAVNVTTQYCTTITNDTQLASINADGTITAWNTIEGLTNLRMGHTLSSWRGNIYGLGGCTSHNPIDGQCADLVLTNDYGTINQDGDASTVSDSVDIGTGTCTGADPYDCDTPPLGNSNGQGGQMAGGIVINNGFVYYIGGCREVGGSGQICTNGSASRTADTIYYAEIANDGTLRRPGTCTGTNIQYAGSWCVDNNNTINGSVGLAAFGYTVFNNTIYVIGGTDGASWQTNVYYNTLNSDGSLNAWTSQTQSSAGLGTTSIGYPYVFARANPASAGTNPGNLYVIGGCSNGTNSGLDCGTGTFFTSVYKCNITTSGSVSGCTTTGQVQLDAEPATGGSQGLGIAAGTVYANYVYLIGGQSPNEDERGEVMYAKLDDSGNIVDPDGETVNDNIWETSPNSISPARRRGIAFGYNGYLYALAGFAVDTGLNDLLFAKIDVTDGSIGAFTTSAVTVNQRWDLRGVVSSGYVYTLGGCSSGAPPATCNSMTSTVQTFQLYNNFSGSTSSFTSSTNDFTTDRIGASAVVLNGYLYLAGGCISATDCTSVTDSVQYAQLADDGSIGTWGALDSLPNGRAWGYLGVAGGNLYYVGGQDSAGDEKNDVYYIDPNPGGTLNRIGEIEHYSAKREAELTTTTTGWSSINGTADTGTTAGNNGWIDSSNFTPGERYLIMAWGGHTTDSTSDRSGLRVKHGSTAFTESEETIESDRTGSLRKKSYFWFTVWTAVSGEDLEVEAFYESNSGTTLLVEDITLIAMNAEDMLATGDLVYDIDTTGGTLTTTPTAAVSLSWTPEYNNDDWWIMSYAKGDTIDIDSDDFVGQLDVNGTNRSYFKMEGEDANDTPIHALGWAEQFTNTAKTVDLELSESGADVEWDAAGVFALRLDNFETNTFFASSGVVAAVENIYVEIAGMDPVIPRVEDFLAVGGATFDHTASGASSLRMTADAQGVALGLAAPEYEGNDDSPATVADIRIDGTAEEVNYDLLGRMSAAGPVDMDERWLIGFSMELAPGWREVRNGLPGDRTKFGGAVWNDRIYIVGGNDDSATKTATVYVSPQLSSGGNITSSWSTSTSFNVARSGLSAMAYANNLYLLGGEDGSNYLNDVQYTQINSDGSVDSWSYTTSLPQNIAYANGFAANGYMYLFGGRSTATVCTDNVYIAPISANTSISSGNNPTGLGEWYQTREAMPGGNRYGAGTAYNQGKAYVLGGGCGATLTYTGTDRTLYATLFSQPQIARYSRMIDTDTDVFPTNWLMNGVDNDIGARWELFYRSSTDTNNTWGQVTNFGEVTLGDVEVYTPLDGTATDTEFARFYYFNVFIDASKTYGYPDDVTRGPTIDDLTLFFTSDPNRRLRHGKTFTGGEKQPLDTPCRQTNDTDCPLP